MDEVTVSCPHCMVRHVPNSSALSPGVYSLVCLNCNKAFKFRSVETVRSQAEIIINGKSYKIDSSDPNVSLNDFIRNVAGLKGTKVMCREAGCGCCVVCASIATPGSDERRVVSVNSCIVPVLACDGWQVTTTEALGGRKAGFDVIQSRVAEHYGSQCGYCTPGFVMNMNALLINSPKPSAAEIENTFDGNLCRCTGFRPILDAMKSFAADAPKSDKSGCLDIEDVAKYKALCCGKKDNGICKPTELRMKLDAVTWLKPTKLSDLLNVLDQNKSKRVRMLVGNTSTGIYKDDGPFDVYVDTKGVVEFYEMKIDTANKTLCIGANITLSELIGYFTSTAKELGSEFAYFKQLSVHLKKVANTPVRNAASWAGNLMIKHNHPEFPSDLFTIFNGVDAVLTIASNNGVNQVPVGELLKVDMKAKAITSIVFSAKPNTVFHSYKIMSRKQNTHAYVNAAFLFQLDDHFKVVSAPNCIYGGIKKNFIHAENTERFLANKSLVDTQVIKQAFETLASEVQPDSSPISSSPAYRKSLSMSLLYKCILDILGDKVPKQLQSGAKGIERAPSTGTHDYDTDKKLWPLTESMPKITAKLQAAGESVYCNDIPKVSGQLYAAFVVTTQGAAKIASVDPKAALEMPGVVRYLNADDIPENGTNNVWPPQMGDYKEPLFATSQIDFAGQAVGVIVADTQVRANMAAKQVKVTYTDVQKPVTCLQEAIAKERFFPGTKSDLKVGDAEKAISDSDKVIGGEVGLGTQYHFHMETQSCLCVPKENVMEVYPTTQWLDTSHSSIAQVLGISGSKIRAEVRRLGGAYGAKISRNFPVGAACALAAYVTDKPVAMALSLEANMQVVGRRFPWYAKYKVGVSLDGKLNGLQITYYNDCGYSPAESTAAYIFPYIDNTYHCENWLLESYAVKTDTPQNTSCRSPGTMPSIFITESLMEHVAKELNMDPTALRRMNMYKANQVTPVGQRLPYFSADKLMDQLHASAEVDKRKSDIESFNKENRWKKKGISVVPLKYAVSWLGQNFNVLLSVYGSDGSVSIAHGGIEVGQGINTRVTQMCAHELGIDMSLITVRPTADMVNANSGYTGSSTTSQLCCLALQRACAILKERLAPVRDSMPAGTSWVDLIAECYQQNIDLSVHYWLPPSSMQHDDQAALYYTYGAMCAEVVLDVLTGENQINRVDVLYDCGQSTNPELDMGQVEGAVTMAIGYHLHEEIKYDPVTGENLVTGTWEYKVPGALDIPVDIRISFVKNSSNPVKVVSSKIVAEPPMSMTCSVLFALKHAIDAARSDAGNTSYFSAGPPTTVEYAQQYCLPDASQLVIK